MKDKGENGKIDNSMFIAVKMRKQTLVSKHTKLYGMHRLCPGTQESARNSQKKQHHSSDNTNSTRLGILKKISNRSIH